MRHWDFVPEAIFTLPQVTHEHAPEHPPRGKGENTITQKSGLPRAPARLP